MKKILFFLFLLASVVSKAQVYNNEWIDYSKTYYKFKVGKTGLYRIPFAVLNTAGLSAAAAENFQLWRNGVQVPIYTSKSSGALSGADYIEFWGLMNDGKADKELYRDQDYQLNDKWSLQTDTAAYFLTVNTTGNNIRLANTANNVSSNSLPVEPYFMYTAGTYFKDMLNSGNALDVGEYLYSSSYDKGEGFTSANIDSATTLTSTLANLFVYAAGPNATLKVNAAGNGTKERRIGIQLNNALIDNSRYLSFFNYAKLSYPVPTSLISNNTAVLKFNNITAVSSDRLVVAQYELTYPRLFNFGGASNFEFTLPSSATGNYLEIAGFTYGTTAPVLYDLTNGKRYVGDISTSGLVKVVLQPSATERNMVLVNEESTNVTTITDLQQRNFINYTAAANQGNYIIISNKNLFNGSGGANPVEDYRAYRSSAVGGGYSAKIYLIDELVDQFAFGIKMHPSSIRNFLRYAKQKFVTPPKNVFLIGKGVNYVSYRSAEGNPANGDLLDKLQFVPTFGWPASDALLVSPPGTIMPEIPIGRLSAINAGEVSTYLKKMKEFELAQATLSPKIDDRGWMKNVVHIVGGGDPDLQGRLNGYMDNYRRIISDTLFGAKVTTFSKSSSDAVQQLSNTLLQSLFEQGITLITYFGHSSSTTLEFNLDNPEGYNNKGKYPMFIGLGCNAGNFFTLNSQRLQTKETLSEKYVLAPDKGTIGFIASTYFGIESYLDVWASRAYQSISSEDYGKTMGEIMDNTIKKVFTNYSTEDFYARCNSEQTELHGDPALRLNPHAKPDYVIEDPMVKVSPDFISIAEASFKVKAKFLNIGKAINKNLVVEIKRQYPDGSIKVVHRDTIPGIRYADSISVNIPIDAITDKGSNKITVTIDADNAVDEFYETNNSITKEFVIYEDEARPISPYNFAIVNKQNIKLAASTANPFALTKQYQMQIDTTELFNSPIKVTKNLTTSGGVMEFDPGISFKDNTVYYWRVGMVPASGNITWNSFSFIYLPNAEPGFNQSHLYQHLKSNGTKIYLDSATGQWKYGKQINNLFIRQGSWVTSATQQAALSVAVNDIISIRLTCWFSSLVFNVFDPVTFKQLENKTVQPYPGSVDGLGKGLYESADPTCFGQETKKANFEFRYTDTAYRRKIMNFMDNVIPDGSYVVIRSFTLDPASFPSYPQAWAKDWAADTAIYGSGKSLYHYLKNAGLSGIDSFYRARPFALVYKKGDASFTPKWLMGEGIYDNPTMSVDVLTSDTLGFVASPEFGPAKAWKELIWNGKSLDAGVGDNPTLDIIGIRKDGGRDTLFKAITSSQPKFDISSINAVQYPFLQLQLRNSDYVYYTPYQLNYWRLTYTPAPEGAVAPNLYFKMNDTIQNLGEPIDFKMAFKNVSDVGFDSLKVKMIITDKNNVQHPLPVFKHRPLAANDTLHVRQLIDTRQFNGLNSLYVEVNPDNDQPEQYHFNNFVYHNFFVGGDSLSPLLDVTFDNVHILNHDLVSAKPEVVIKLKDESKFLLLDDTSLVSVQVRFPGVNGQLKTYHFDNDTLSFTPAQASSSGDNTATIRLKPEFTEDGEYELIVKGKDKSNNQAGAIEYRVAFEVINKPMISNMLNYPNPFTTSTAFVFTLTGSNVPEEFKIQVLTVTGKVVREITKMELGPLHIGRNITEFKWDGTDQFGQKLANGVYLYRVVTSTNGKSLDKYSNDKENTDKYFNKGYGKMYLMR